MIASVSGIVAAVGTEAAVVEVGGVGLSVQCTPATLATLRPGESVRLATAMVVREDSLTLFGFVTDDERVVFDILQSVSGVGPKLAQAVTRGPLRRHATREAEGPTAGGNSHPRCR